MGSNNVVRVDWYAKDSYPAFCKLTAEEIGVFMQIMNLIYIEGAAIDYNAKFIGKSCNINRSRCERIIQALLQKGEIFLTEDGKIHKKRCQEELRIVRERIEKYSKNGKKGSEIRWSSEEKQLDRNEDAISHSVTSTSTKAVSKISQTRSFIDLSLASRSFRFLSS